MRRTIRHLPAAVAMMAAALLLFTLFCTINDDNGQPVGAGTPLEGGGGVVVGGGGGDGSGGSGGSGGILSVPSIVVEGAYVGIGDTVPIVVTLHADTSRTTVISGGSIKVTVTPRSGGAVDWVSSSVLTTNANGQAVIRFSSNTEGTVGLKFAYGGAAERSISIVVTDDPPRNITISASPQVLAADGSSKSAITVQVKNNDNNPIVGDVIQFSTSIGLITALGTTDSDGKATAQLTSEKRNAVATVTATLKSDGSRNVKIAVEFSGVTVSASASPETIKPDGKDTTVILAVLLDAANNPIVGEKVSFSKVHAQTKFVRVDSTTNNRGEARCVISSTAVGEEGEPITVRAAGAEKSVGVTYTNQLVVITPAGDNSYIAGTANKSTFAVRYTQGNGTTPIPNAELRVTVTMGDNLTDPDSPDPSKVVFAQIFRSNDDGYLTFTFNNPNFTGLMTVYVKGVANGTSAVDSKKFLLRANGTARLTIVASPDVIGTNGGKAKLTATAYDAFGNRVGDEVISFNVIAGAGGGEYLDPPTATTAQDGTASTYLIAGTLPSAFKAVKAVAATYGGLRSDTVSLTIAGPPKNITVRVNEETVTAGTAIYGWKLAAIVSDINNNPVPDGTEVTFSTKIVGYRYYMLEPSMHDEKCVMDTVAVDVESEYFGAGTRPYRPFPSFNDYNYSGFPESNARVCNQAKDQITSAGEGAASSLNDLYIVVDYKGGKWVVPRKEAIPAYDLDLGRGGVADPSASTAVIITRTVTTKNGIADNELLYGQSDAGKVRVRIWAECQGLVTSNPVERALPVGEDAKNWSPFH